MQFTSPLFLFNFLPIAVLGFLLLGWWKRGWVLVWLTLISVAFYGFLMKPLYVVLLLGSMIWNYQIGRWLLGQNQDKPAGHSISRGILFLGIAVDLLVLGYFKYFSFLVGNINQFWGQHWLVPQILLPAGISFFTFTQIAFLVDAYSGKVKNLTPVSFALFVSYFPHLMAGPILHHQEMLPQFHRRTTMAPRLSDLTVGLSIFFFGLFKKICFADQMARCAEPIFNTVDQGHPIGMIEAWMGALTFTLQLYFDFSGYSDMAIGLSRIFGISLPINFNSPYKAHSIIDFWRRWHMTLSRFLRDYLYIPLGGNRLGPFRRFVNLLVTMVLGGIWHGAGWTFLLWGLLHGIYLCVNHTVRVSWGTFHRLLSQSLTFFCVVVAWVLFKAGSVTSALTFYRSMFDPRKLNLPSSLEPHLGRWAHYFKFTDGLLQGNFGVTATDLGLMIILLGVAFFCPNTQEIFSRYKPGLNFEITGLIRKRWYIWQPLPLWAVVTTGVALAGLMGCLISTKVATFLYYRF